MRLRLRSANNPSSFHRRCSHINIARLLGAVSVPPNFCLVMEYARGRCWRQLGENVVSSACTDPHLMMNSSHAPDPDHAGGPLSSALQEVKLEPAVIMDWAQQIARGMNYLHNESPVTVVHRDLKSNNILLLHVRCMSATRVNGFPTS